MIFKKSITCRLKALGIVINNKRLSGTEAFYYTVMLGLSIFLCKGSYLKHSLFHRRPYSIHSALMLILSGWASEQREPIYKTYDLFGFLYIAFLDLWKINRSCFLLLKYLVRNYDHIDLLGNYEYIEYTETLRLKINSTVRRM